MNSLNYKYKNASFFKRLTAFYLNFFFISLSTAFCAYILVEFNLFGIEFNTYRFWLILLLLFFVFVITDSFFQNLMGANLSKRLLGLKIVDRNTNENIGIFRSLVRCFTGLFSFLLFGLGFIAIAFNKESLSMHDLLSGTKVIQKERNQVLSFITNFFASFVFILGSFFLAIFLAALIFAPISLAKSFYSLAQYSKYDLEDLKAGKSFNIKINNDKIFAFIYSNKPDYLSFELDPNQEHSSLSWDAAKKLDLELIDYFFVIKNFGSDLSAMKIKPAYLAEHLCFKDINEKDLDLYDFSFILSDKSIIASDLLDNFAFNVDEQKNQLILKAFRGDSLIINNSEYDLEAKQYLVFMLRKIRRSWTDYLRHSSPEILEDLTDLKSELRNQVDLLVDTETGYVMKATLVKPTGIEAFDKMTENFLSEIERLRMMPDSLKDKKQINIELDLVYQELI